MIEEEGLMQRIGGKIKQTLSRGKHMEELVKLDMQGRELTSNEELKDTFESFHEELVKCEEDMVRLGNEEMFTAYRKLRDATAPVTETLNKMQSNIEISRKFMNLEIQWLYEFEKFEAYAKEVYTFALKFNKTNIFTPELKQRVEVASRRIAVAMGLLNQGNVNVAQNFVPIDAYLAGGKKAKEKYHEEFEEKRKKLQGNTNKASQ